MYLGVDGGGTKTSFVLIDQQGRLLAKYQGGSSYHPEAGLDGVAHVLHEGVSSLLGNAEIAVSDLDFAFFGLPAQGEDSRQLEAINALPAAMIPGNKYVCGNDMVCGWAAALGCSDGITITAGTGSIAYGENCGAAARCGGWGEIFGDEGSAYWIACRGLQAFSHMSDGRNNKGPLYYLLKAELNLQSDLDLYTLVCNQWGAQRSRISQLSKTVYEAAIAGDITSIEIFAAAAREFAFIVDATRKRLDFGTNEVVNVSYSGGVFSAGELLIEPLRNELQSHSSNFALRSPRYQTSIGAALYAAKLDGFQFTDESLKHFVMQGQES